MSAKTAKEKEANKARGHAKPMTTRARKVNYLRQTSGKRIHLLGSEGGYTGPQRRRVRHKMNHHKATVMRRKMKEIADAD